MGHKAFIILPNQQKLMPNINEIIQEESKKIVNKYLEQINERINRAKEELLRKVDEIRNIK
ncbi:hypothetical protein JCM14467A_25540 [Vulcanisaeta sp. JCM 14467]